MKLRPKALICRLLAGVLFFSLAGLAAAEPKIGVVVLHGKWGDPNGTHCRSQIVWKARAIWWRARK